MQPIHRIQQQSLELEWSTGEVSAVAAHPLSKALTPYLQEHVLPRMEELFDQLTKDGRTIHAEKIVLNLGEFSIDDWQRDLCQKLLSQLRERLLESDSLPDDPNTDTEEFEVIIFKQLLYFFRYGRLPRWNPRAEGMAMRTLPQHFKSAEWKEFSRLLSEHEQALRRFLQFCGEREWRLCLRKGFGIGNIDAVLSFFIPTGLNNDTEPLWLRVCWLQLFRVVIVRDQSPAARQIMLEWLVLREAVTALAKYSEGRNRQKFSAAPTSASLLNQLPSLSTNGELTLEFSRALAKLRTLPSLWRQWLEPLRDQEAVAQTWSLSENNCGALLQLIIAGKPVINLVYKKTSKAVPSPTSSTAVQSLSQTRATDPVTRKHLRLVEKPSLDEKPTKDQSLLAAGAGVVITHPFVTELFREQGLLVANSFQDSLARHTAVRMLAYLSFGELVIEEYDLLLPKLLCDMPWNEVLPVIELSTVHKAAANQLLQAILRHWRALKSQSVDFLRQQFFWRQGRLKAIDNGWGLSIEKRAQDILLDKLPWGTGVIRLPWMKEALHVDWNGRAIVNTGF
jgi:hypothetical protein